MPTANEIRATFLDYFAAHDHEVAASSPLVPHNDPTLLFTNAGMVQFKNVFTGGETRERARAVTSQKCVRAGGKHNDLDNVGYTARHHTFFEMLGNFSFGDYFKDVAIELAWKLVTKEYGLPAERLWITVYAEDEEAFDLWRRIARVPEERIVRIATSDNFWAMGDTGPCGPCSEIFYDHGPALAGGPPGSADEDGDRYTEIWNLVFMQFEQVSPDRRVPLPRPSIDTGMGLERIAAILQGKHDNYDCDLLRTLIEASAEATGTAPDGPHAVAHRVIADHLRASCFLLADGVMPANEGRGYVLRRIMRRAMRHAHMIGCEEPLMWRLVPALNAAMGQVYEELVRAEPLVTETLELEETRFKRTLERGLRLLDEEVAKLGAGATLDGEVAFKLYDTYGFPLDLTQDALRGGGRAVDVDGFNAAMERQRAEARRSWAGSGAAATEEIWFALRERLGATEFLGYETEAAEGRILAVLVDGVERDSAAAGERVEIVTNQTPFYGESGGQVGDSGVMFSATGGRMAVADTHKKLGDLHVHVGEIGAGRLAVGEDVELRVDGERRAGARAHHSATHLLHAALRAALGGHVTQKGSLVAPDRLRFDFSHPRAMTADELDAVETAVNRQIRANREVRVRLMAPEEAIAAGALALFGEKYGAEVRVLSMGVANDTDAPYSVELCGGTHVARSGDIGLFKVVSEGALAAGVRRIESVAGAAALAHIRDQERHLRAAAGRLKAQPHELAGRIDALLEERRRLERDLAATRRRMAAGGGGGLPVREVNGFAYAADILDGVPARELRGMVDEAKKGVGSGVVALVSTVGGKAALIVGVTDDLLGRIDAVDLARIGVAELGGRGGGGRPDMAQGGGSDADKAPAAIAAIARALGEAA